jgi:hypothetical protein
MNEIVTPLLIASGTLAGLLNRICKPAADELGQLWADNVHAWRMANLEKIAKAAEEKLKDSTENIQAAPRLICNIVQEASLIDDPYLQDMWSGLLASSCNENGDDDSNLIFVNILSNLTKLQARVLKYACENTHLSSTPELLVQAINDVTINLSTLKEIAGESDIQRLDRELDHLRALELIVGGFNAWNVDDILITPTTLALHLYVRCNGSRLSPADYFSFIDENQGLSGAAGRS